MMMNSEISGADYQVFLSFRGEDTRQGFTDCLYHFLIDAGIRVFRDNEEVRPGEKIEAILTAINNSIVCIPIFSKGYASSKWCLIELTKMVELKKIIMPVFFDVKPDDVKLETPLYRDALCRLNGDGADKEKWEKALKEVLEAVSGWNSNIQEEQVLKQVVKIKGWELKDKGYAELCKAIVAEVLTDLKVRDRIVSDCLVGMEDKVEKVLKLLNTAAPGVRSVLIHGIGGSGKTTLAKLVFNQLNSSFQHRSFLSDVRELSERHGVIYLQKQLLVDTCHVSKDISSSDEGVRAIQEILSNKKVLIVLDDVDRRKQIENLIPSSESLGSGSRIIVTSRDKRVLATRQGLASQFKMDELDPHLALELFSMHAFGLNFPPFEYLHLSKEVVSLSGHLPVYLEVAGSYLSRKSREEWNTYITELRKVPEKNIQEKLMISYNALDIRTKQVFLDIACFFINKDKGDAIYMWEACGFHPDSGLEELTSKSMVKVIDGSKLWMHEFMRDLGREIVCQENLIDPGKRSRLWIHEEALGILERKEGTRKVQALCLSVNEPSKCFTRRNFKNLINLRLLEWSGPKLQGTFPHLLSKLRWLHWRNCPLDFEAEMLNLANLVLLDLSGNDICENWKGWSQTNMGCNLKVLNLTNCAHLTKTPDLSKFTGLERLILRGCIGLTEIDCSIRMVKRLKHLNLTGCYSLRGLPDELRFLDDLEEIFMVGGGKEHIFSLPKYMGNLVRLTILELKEVRVTELPESICNFKRLVCLALTQCLGISKFPDSFGNLRSLVKLDARECYDLCELPCSIGNLKQLKEMFLGYTKLTLLPSEVGRLKQLKVIELQRTQMRQLPNTIGMLEQLEELNVQGARRLTVIPPQIDGLSRLKNLDLSNTLVKVLPSLSKLSHLQTLRLFDCNKLLEVPELPASLTDLKVTSGSVQKVLSDFSMLNSLINLEWACPKVGWPWGKKSHAPHLSRLILGDLHLTIDIISWLSTLENLSSLRLVKCKFGKKFQRRGGVGCIKSLKILEIINCDCMKLDGNSLPENLEQLRIYICHILTSLDVSHLKKLESLRTISCKQLKEIVDQLKSTRRLQVVRSGCPSFGQLTNNMVEKSQLIFLPRLYSIVMAMLLVGCFILLLHYLSDREH